MFVLLRKYWKLDEEAFVLKQDYASATLVVRRLEYFIHYIQVEDFQSALMEKQH